MDPTVFEPCWLGLEEVFGGYVLARVVDRSLEVGGPGAALVPRAVTLHFVSVVRAGAADLRVQDLHLGRSTVSRRVEVWQEGRIRAHAVASLVRSGDEVGWAEPMSSAAWGEAATAPAYDLRPRQLPFAEHLELRRAAPESFAAGTSAWARLDPGAFAHLSSHGAAALLLDVLPPGLFATSTPPRFVPTVDFTVHFSPMLEQTQPDWVVVTNRTVWASTDHCVDESILCRADGHVLAQLRQGRSVRWR